MKAVVAIDSLKGSLSSVEAGNAIAEGIRRADAQAEVVVRPLADGGEGTVDALVQGMNGSLQQIQVTGPLGDPVDCAYGIIEEEKMAVIEMSAAAGITLVPDERKNPLFTTTYGVGEMIRDAIQKGCRKFVVGIAEAQRTMAESECYRHLGMSFWTARGIRFLTVLLAWKILRKLRAKT